MKLNPEQQNAVEYVQGPLLVLAGAGSGKTRVITQKIVHLIHACRMAPEHIYAVTFTNKAAREMQTRVLGALNKARKSHLRISTFHMLGLSMLKQDPEKFGLKKGFTIYDQDDAALTVGEQVRKLKALQLETPEQLAAKISQFKAELLSHEQLIKSAQTQAEFSLGELFGAYQKALHAINAVDLDDLLYLPVTRMRADRELLNKWQDRVRYMLVDEYQDTNNAQYELMKLLTRHHQRFTVVGDDDQAIYSWRGANPANLKTLSTEFPTLKIIKLEQNYRSTTRILNAANSLIAKNEHVFAKKLWSRIEGGDRIRVIQAADEQDEAEKVVKALQAHQIETGNPFHHYAILYRGNYQARPFERMLREFGITYHLSGGTSFFDRTEVKDILAYLKLLANPDDDNAFLRIINTPRREIGVQTLEKLRAYAQEREHSLFASCGDMALTQLLNSNSQRKFEQFSAMMLRFARQAEDEPIETVKSLVQDIGYEQWLLTSLKEPVMAEKRMENVNELIGWIQQLHKKEPLPLSELVQKMMLINILGKDDDTRSGCVHLMTLHAAKGLEFPNVYMVGMEERLLPHHASQSDHQVSEERRLCYVGMTRAQRNLTLSLACKRKRQGGFEASIPSRFLQEIEAEHLGWDNDPGAKEASKEKAKHHLDAMRRMLQAKNIEVKEQR